MAFAFRAGRERKRPRMQLRRSSGVLLHPTSLPRGRLDEEAYRFIDWLAAAGQSWWQVLPLGPPDEEGSPYKAASAFVAAHPYWSGGWAAHAGAGALADQVRFAREWGRLRSYAAERGVRLFGDL